ncbi:hypothetical protein [Camelimonas lactis]|uniref:Uncharacterized protein n=1 Tax=Camelimonas lactis TaxID=659006 RepID=A0A4R2GTE1_9HYPH|nr:hypothetical protein [Camelimonas lactis]TCO12006.1 hypothetical protein EV666_11044 [Camelimonas lactis]
MSRSGSFDVDNDAAACRFLAQRKGIAELPDDVVIGRANVFINRVERRIGRGGAGGSWKWAAEILHAYARYRQSPLLTHENCIQLITDRRPDVFDMQKIGWRADLFFSNFSFYKS